VSLLRSWKWIGKRSRLVQASPVDDSVHVSHPGNRDRDLLRAKDGTQDRLNGGRGSDRAVVDATLDLLTSIETIL